MCSPHLDYRYLSDSWDWESMREAVHLCIWLVEHEAFREIVAERVYDWI